MYKKQLSFQRIVCLLAIIAGAACFIYSLGIMTDLYDCLYTTMMNPKDLTQTSVEGSIVYYDMQGFNRSFVAVSIVMILLNCLLFITNTNTRRKYYIGNYVAVALNLLMDVFMTVWAHFEIEKYKAQFLQLDFEALRAHADLWDSAYTESTVWFDIHYGVFGFILLVAALLIINLIWKVLLMKVEKRLIAKGKEAAI